MESISTTLPAYSILLAILLSGYMVVTHIMGKKIIDEFFIAIVLLLTSRGGLLLLMWFIIFGLYLIGS